MFLDQLLSLSVRPHGLQHARLPCPSLSSGVCWNSCPLSWCHPIISSSVAPFSSCPQPFPASGSFPVSWLFATVCGAAKSWTQLSINTHTQTHTHIDTHTHRHTHTSNLRVCKSHLQTLVTLKCLLRKQVPGPTGGHLSRLYKHRGRWERLVWRTSAGPGAELV